MSGPKVVDIQAIRRRQQRDSARALTVLTASVDECNGLLREADPAEIHRFRENVDDILSELDALRTAENWERLLESTNAYRDFYTTEVSVLRDKAIQIRAKAMQRGHQTKVRALQLNDDLKALPASSERDALLRQLSSVQQSDTVEDTLLEEVARYITEARAATSKAKFGANLQKLAELYADPSAASEAAPVLPGSPQDAENARMDRFWIMLAEIEANPERNAVIVQEWKAQLAAIEKLPRHDRPLQLDSLSLNVAEYLKSSRASRSARDAINQIVGELEASEPWCGQDDPAKDEREEWVVRLRAALSGQLSTAKQFELAQQARDWLALQVAHGDSRARRASVLQALVVMGYEVNESMHTAWIENGRLIVHKPDDPVYGVEITSPASGTAIQARVVASASAPRTQQRDTEVEISWCGEFDRLREYLADQGLATTLRHAQEPGSVAIKTIVDDTVHARPAQQSVLKERRI
ncbi:MAG TPA: hypothetical protein VK970_16225 [Candidatus Methylacidiphilales bacterium]|nr:hypothetical protein [Candidatus Methylacidiphilales bacterium]